MNTNRDMTQKEFMHLTVISQSLLIAGSRGVGPLAFAFSFADSLIQNPTVYHTYLKTSQWWQPSSRKSITPDPVSPSDIYPAPSARPYVIDGKLSVDSASKYFAVMSTWDPHQKIDEYVQRHLRCLKDAGIRCVLVMTSGAVRAEDIETILPLVDSIIVRDNIGYDFNSYLAGINLIAERYGLSEVEGLLVLNDSILGPINDSQEFYQRLKQKSDGLWGMNDSRTVHHHLQSFFLYFPRDVIRHSAFNDFWKRVKPGVRKWDVIAKYEIGLSRLMSEQNVPIHALFPLEQSIASARRVLELMFENSFIDKMLSEKRINPTVHLWSILIDYLKYPFLKRSVFLAGPSKIVRYVDPIQFIPDHQDLWEAYRTRVKGFF